MPLAEVCALRVLLFQELNVYVFCIIQFVTTCNACVSQLQNVLASLTVTLTVVLCDVLYEFNTV